MFLWFGKPNNNLSPYTDLQSVSHSHIEVYVDILKGSGEGFVHPLEFGVKGQGLFDLLCKSFKCHTDRFYEGVYVVFRVCL